MADNFLTLLNKQRPDIEKLLASWITAERFFAMAMQIERNPELADCTPQSLVDCVIQAAQMGLEVGGTRGHIYVIKYGKTAQAQPGWRGLAFLRLRAGSIMQVDTEVVFKFEKFRISRSNGPEGDQFIHEIDLFGERLEKNAIGAYARVKLPSGEHEWEAISAERIQRHRQHSKQPNGLLWTKFWEEGWRKTPYRILDKRLPEGLNGEAIERYNVARSIETTSYRIDPDAAPDDLPTPKSVEVVRDADGAGRVEVSHAGSEDASKKGAVPPSPGPAAPRAGGAEDQRSLLADTDAVCTSQDKAHIRAFCDEHKIKDGVFSQALFDYAAVDDVLELKASQLPGLLQHLEKFA